MNLKKHSPLLVMAATLIVLVVVSSILMQDSHKTSSSPEIGAIIFDSEGNLHICYSTGEPNAPFWYRKAVREPDGSFTWLPIEQINCTKVAYDSEGNPNVIAVPFEGE